MRFATCRLATMLALAFLSMPARSAEVRRGRLVLPLDAPVIDARLDGRPLRLRVAFDAPGVVALDPAAAARLGLVPTGDSVVLVGPVRIGGASRAARLLVDGRTVTVQLIWTAAPPAGPDPGVDGIISPATLPFAVVRLSRGPASAATGTALAARFRPGDGLVVPWRDGIDLRLAPQRAETIATAAAALALAGGAGGAIAPSTASRVIGYGVARPVGTMTLARAVPIAGGVTLRRLLVRTADDGAIGSAGLAGTDEIVVTASDGSAPRRQIMLGADALGTCRALEWRATTRRILLDCP